MQEFTDDVALDAGGWDRRFARVLAKVRVGTSAIAIIDANGADGGGERHRVEVQPTGYWLFAAPSDGDDDYPDRIS